MSLNAEVSTLESARAEAEDELKKIRKGLRESHAAEPGKVLHLESEIRGLKKTVAALKAKYSELYKRHQEHIGRVRVFACVRPFVPSDGAAQDAKPVVVLSPDGEGVELAAADSLSELRNVIRKLAAKGKPTYRNSMLTKLLRPALSAGGKTLLIVNVSPTEESREETRGSLLFAQMSKEVELGKAKKNVGHA